MLLAFDIGNTNIVVALFDASAGSSGSTGSPTETNETNEVKGTDSEPVEGGETPAKILHQWRIATDPRRTGDEYFSIVRTLMVEEKVSFDDVTDSVVSSVVPSLIGPFITVAQKITGKKPLLITGDVFEKLPIKMHEDTSHQIGTDLLCNALEGWLRVKSAVIIVDFGTALTFTAVGDDAQIKGIAIAPGLGTAMRSLSNNTAQLPQVALSAPSKVLGTTTAGAMQSGVVFGYKGLVESMIEQIKTEMAEKHGCEKEKIHVIATGGLNSVLKPITDCFEDYDESLTLQGLRHVLLYCR